MKAKIFTHLTDDQIIMRSIEKYDIEYLRIWKNEYKEFFFFKNEISPEAQLNWFYNFNQRKEDHMFIIENTDTKIGCIGARIYEDFVDVYNVILGNKNFEGKHLMTKAMDATIALCNLLYKGVPVRVRVLKSNPAVNWYQRIGFKIIDDIDDYLLMEHNKFIENKYLFNIEIELP